ncbi:MAG: hypothetical protein JO002_06080 [Burkholderiaceae bacterium]|nr:hypothetical protein [Burkholderiaceae bacterium]
MTLKPIVACAALAVSATTFASGDTDVHEREYALPKCDKPVAKVMFSDFKCKAADCSASGSQQETTNNWWADYRSGRVRQPDYRGVGTGMGDMLATALTQTGCFEVMERAQMAEVAQELALVGKKVQAQQADYMITGSVTSLGFDQSGLNLGGLGFFNRIPLVGAAAANLSFKKTKAHLNLDIRVIDINKATIRGSKTFEGDNSRTGIGVGGWGVGSGGLLGGSASSISGTPLEEVARDVLIRSTNFVVDTLAQNAVSERVPLVKADDSAKN